MHRIRVRRPAHRARTRSGAVLVVAAACLWGTAGLAGAVIHERSGLSGLSIGFWRLAAGAVATLPLLVRPAAGALRAEWKRLLTVGAALASYQASFFAAVNLAGVSLSTLIALGLAPVLITIGGRTLLREAPERATLVASGTALLGLVLLVGAPSQRLGATALVGGPGRGIGNRLRRGDAGLDTATGGRFCGRFTSATFWVGALVVLPLAMWQRLTIPQDR